MNQASSYKQRINVFAEHINRLIKEGSENQDIDFKDAVFDLLKKEIYYYDDRRQQAKDRSKLTRQTSSHNA